MDIGKLLGEAVSGHGAEAIIENLVGDALKGGALASQIEHAPQGAEIKIAKKVAAGQVAGRHCEFDISVRVMDTEN